MYNKVFIIDDDEISIFLAENMLEVIEFAREFKGFLYANEALAELIALFKRGDYQHLPDIMFLDLNMPHMSGWEFLDALMPYEQILSSRCQIYILTSSIDAEEIEKAKKYKIVSSFLQKPLEDSAIAEISRKA
ncbi:response regulator [uncultured Pontibacter sp.]|uniref:response regulator n=1 Tax=uncultured Pontibacter sp. TaxID=453356 RepID=UPI0026349F14|nr:response regulator [uncultured Pontibacter sp.]